MSETLSYTAVALQAQKHRPAFHVPWHPELMRYAADYQNAASATSTVDACMLAAIVLRESGGQNIFQNGMRPGPDCGVGLCQITYNVDWSNLLTPTYPGYGALLDPAINLRVAAIEFLNPLLTTFPGNHIAAFAAYNCGPGAVTTALKSGRSPDSVTTGRNYGSDVFKSWINFAAASMGVQVNWAGFSGAESVVQTQAPVITGIGAVSPMQPKPVAASAAGDDDTDLANF